MGTLGRVLRELAVIAIATLILTLGSLCFIVTFAIALPYRALVQFLVLIFRPDLDSFVTGLNSFFAVNGTTFNSIACATVEGLVDVETAQRTVQEQLFSAQKKREHRRLTQSWTNFLGFGFWKPDRKFDIKNHVRLYDGEGSLSLPTPCREIDLHEKIGTLFKLSWEKDRSPWEILVVHISDAEGKIRSAVVIRIAHVLADGLIILNMFRCITQSPFTVPELNYRRRVFTIWERLGLVFKIPYDAAEVIWTVRNSCKLSSENIEMDSPAMFSVSPKIPVEMIKFIKNRFQVSFAAVIYAIYIGTLERALRSCGQQVPKSAAVSFVLPFISNPAPGQISATILFAAWPMKTPSALHRLMKIQKRFDVMSRSTATYLFTYVAYVGAYVPTFVKTIWIKEVHKFFYHSNNFSIFPITTLPDFYGGDEISDIIMCNDTTSGYEYGMSTMIGGLNNQLRFNFHISKGFLKSDEVVKKFPTYVIEELQQLVDEANDKGTFFVENSEDTPV